MKSTGKLKYWSGLIVVGMSFILAYDGRASAEEKKSAEFAFTIPKPATEFKTADPITASGGHRLRTNEHVWIFLLDIFGGYYLQNPTVELLEDGKWEATNIRPGKGIRAIVAVYVSPKGDERIRKWVEVNRWGKISAGEVRELPGYRELARVPIITPKPD